MTRSGIIALLDRAARTPELDAPSRLRDRLALLDALDSAVAYGEVDDSARPLVLALQDRLDAANERVFDEIREAIRTGNGREALLAWIPSSQHALFPAGNPDGYDDLDAIVSGVLRIDEPAATQIEPTPDMVFYQPTQARHIVDLVQRTSLSATDALLDLGAGLGHVAIVVSILSGAEAVGVELEPAYVDAARACATALGLTRVRFVQGDARFADLSRATVVHLYTPFGGAMLRDMLDALRREAKRRSFLVTTLGPCTSVVAEEEWLSSDDVVRPDRIVVFRTR